MNRTQSLAWTLGAAVIIAGAGTLSAVSHAQTQPAAPAPTAKSAALPLDGTWNIDPMHTFLTFSIQHMLVSQVHGRFDKFSGVIVADTKDMSKSSVKLSIDAASIDTGVPQRDGHLKTADFFDVAQYPTITFESSKIERKGGNNWLAHGTFTMHGISKEVVLPFKLLGPVKDMTGTPRFGLHSSLKINRQDYGVKWNKILDNGGLAVGNEVDIDISLEGIPSAPEAETPTAEPAK